MLKRIIISALCLCLLVVLVACGKDNGKDETELPVEENNTTENGTTENGSEGDTNTDQNGNGNNTGSETYYNPDTGEIILPWVP